jgi:hypothetical protein
LDLPIRVEYTDQSGSAVELTGRLCNISARGALGNLPGGFQPGTRVRVEIALPFSQLAWICYEGEVVRSEPVEAGVETALKFISTRPSFRGTDILS